MDNPEQKAGTTIKTYAGQGYDPTYLARKYKISKPLARELIKKFGHDRDRLNEAAAQLKMDKPSS